MPIGPEESGPMWYAQARLAITTWGCMVWGQGVADENEHHIYLSRVMDRTAAFTIALLDDLLGRIDLSGTTDILLWSDVGTHFRSYAVLGTVGIDLVDKYRTNIHPNYGPEVVHRRLRKSE